MTQIQLSPAAWTKVANGQCDDAIDITSVSGSFLCSLVVANEEGAVAIAKPPLPSGGNAWSKRTVEPGISVFARAIGAEATANIAPVPA